MQFGESGQLGSGSIGLGWAIERFGFARAFAAGAALSIFAWPYFLWAAGRFSREETAGVEDPASRAAPRVFRHIRC